MSKSANLVKVQCLMLLYISGLHLVYIIVICLLALLQTLVDKIDDLIAWMEKYDDDLRRGIAANTCTQSNQATLRNETNNVRAKFILSFSLC